MLKTCCLCCWCVGGIIIHTWSAKLTVLLLLTSIHIHAPGMESKGEEVLEASGRTHYSVEAFQPFLTLFKGGELTPDGSITGHRVILCVYCVCTPLFSFTVQHNVAALFSCHLFSFHLTLHPWRAKQHTCPPPASLETDEEKSRGCIFIYSVKYRQPREKKAVDQCYKAQLGPWRESLLHARNATSLKLTTRLH